MKSWRSKEPTMGRSFSTDEHGRCKFHGDVFDPGFEFLQFLEEAKQSGAEASNFLKEVDRIAPEAEEERKKKKSWRKDLLSWWKSEEKKSREGDGKLHRHSHRRSHLPGTRSDNSSGPVKFRGMAVNGGPQLSLSGSVSGLFKSSRRDGTQIPYSSIHDLQSSPAVVRTYGPIYLVT